MRRRDRRWVAVGALLLAGAGFGLGPGASAQEAAPLASQFGGFKASGRANGIQFTYNAENVFPLPAPLFQASLPEASAGIESGPTATALGSVAYPGNVVANLPAVVAQAAPDAASYVPGYPVVTRADYPAGPFDGQQDIGPSTAVVRATESLAQATTSFSGADLPAFARVGSITTSAQTQIVEGAIESRSRVELTGVDLLFGLLHIESVVTDLVATTDGTTAATAGGTTVAGASFLGLPVTIGPEGITVEQPSAPENPGPLGPVVDGVGDLTPLGEGLASAVAPLSQALQDVLGTTNASVNELLAASGISIRTLEPFEVLHGSAGERTANGIVVDIVYDGRGDNPLAQLLAAIPDDALPGESLSPQIPLNTSPQALVNLLKETHVVGLALAYGNVNLDATPAFDFAPPPFAGGDIGAGSPGGGFTPAPRATPPSGFSTPTPALPPAGGGPVGTLPAAAIGGAGAGAAVLLALLSAPIWAVGTRNLADTVLGAAGASCPEGLDRLPKEV